MGQRVGRRPMPHWHSLVQVRVRTSTTATPEVALIAASCHQALNVRIGGVLIHGAAAGIREHLLVALRHEILLLIGTMLGVFSGFEPARVRLVGVEADRDAVLLLA